MLESFESTLLKLMLLESQKTEKIQKFYVREFLKNGTELDPNNEIKPDSEYVSLGFKHPTHKIMINNNILFLAQIDKNGKTFIKIIKPLR